MALRMTKLDRDKATRAWIAKKGIPAECREIYKRLYGQKFEVKARWPASLSEGEAKRRFGTWLSEVEGRIEAIRASQNLAPSGLTDKALRGLAGAASPGDPESWQATASAMEEMEEIAPVADAVLNAVAAKHGVALTDGDRRKLAGYLASAEYAAYQLLARNTRPGFRRSRRCAKRSRRSHCLINGPRTGNRLAARYGAGATFSLCLENATGMPIRSTKIRRANG